MSTANSASEWLDMMASTVTIDAWVSNSISGVPTFAGAPVSYPAYISMKNHKIIDKNGREVMAKGFVILATTDPIGVNDKITLPSTYVPSTPPIMAVNISDDEYGPHHVTIEIG